jgi:hypothetical protein
MLLAALLLAAACNAHPIYAVQPIVSGVRVARHGNAYVASAQLRFTLKTTARAILPRNADAGLRQHVQGHMVVARRVIRSSDGSVEANGSSAAQARTRLKQTIDRMRSDLQSELVREERAYDDVTANGAQQSQGPQFGFPGGPDSTTPCVR